MSEDITTQINVMATAGANRLDMLASLAADLPVNSFGLPLGLYRLDLIGDNPTREELANAWISLTYSEGFPTFPDGRPLWSQLPFEPMEAFAAFDTYLVAPLKNGKGVRALHELIENAESWGLSGLSVEALQMFYYGFFWEHRVKAYDLWWAASRRKQLEFRAQETVDEHYVQARKLMAKLSEYLEDEEEFWDLMTPKVGIDLFKTLVGAQRVSAGLPANGPVNLGAGAGGGARNAGVAAGAGVSLEVIYRDLAHANAASASDGVLIDHDTQILQDALDDPETAEMAQELIIKLNTGTGT